MAHFRNLVDTKEADEDMDTSIVGVKGTENVEGRCKEAHGGVIVVNFDGISKV